jgi:5-methylcytosine-specific restriction endonuclease McrA
MSLSDHVLWGAQCGHDRTELRRKFLTNGSMQLRWQCLSCGQGVGSAHSQKNLTRPLESYALWDKQAEDALWSAYARERDAEASNWWGDYNLYLRSERWARKREKVLRRAGGTCEACGERPAQEVHHLTYRNVGAEPLWDLRAVCRPCHDFIHGEEGSQVEGRAA